MKVERLVALGFDETQAVLLAAEDVDLHLLEDLVARGCDRHLAAEIAC